MDIPKASTAAKASKKSKAVGAFRVLFNLLHKPHKKKSDHAPTNKACQQQLSTAINSHDTDTGVLPTTNSDEKSIIATAESDSVSRKSETLEIPEVKNIEKVLISKIGDSHSRPELEKKANNCDDDVFLNDSYFEDDYTEDYSGSSGEFNSDAYQCCDVPDQLYDEAYEDCADIFGSYNLNVMETVDKPYVNKIIPDFTIRDEFPMFNSKLASTRKRHHSMPDDLHRFESDACSTCKDFENKNSLKRLYSCGDYRLESQADSLLATPCTREPKCTPKLKCTPKIARMSEMSTPLGRNSISSSQCPTPYENVLAEPAGSNSRKENIGPIVIVDFEKAFNNTRPIQLIETTTKNKYALNTLNKASKAGKSANLVQSTDTKSKTLKPLKETKSEDGDTKGRRPSDGSMESGYMTSRRASSSSTPPPHTSNYLPSPSPTLNRSPVFQNDEILTDEQLDQIMTESSPSLQNAPPLVLSQSSLTKDQLVKFMNNESTSPNLQNHPTPLHKLHSGTPLSPHSLNTIDGLITNKPRPAPRRSLKPKFIFPPTKTASPHSGHPGTTSNLIPLPEIVEPTSVVNEHFKGESAPQNQDTTLLRNTITKPKTIEEKTSAVPPNPKFQIDLNVSGIGTTKQMIKPSSNPIDISLNVSVSIVDMNQVPQPGNLVDENPQLPSSLSCFPPSPPAKNSSQNNTPKLESHTPTHAITMSDYLNDVIITSPFGKTMRPLCTSSPLPNKFAPKTRKTNSAQTKRVASFDSFTNFPVQIDCSRRSSHEPDGKKSNAARQKPRRSDSDRRKRLVKRKSARARLDFNSPVGLNDSDTNIPMDVRNMSAFHPSISGDYVLLKRLSESIVMLCENRGSMNAWVDIPTLMENVSCQYDKILKSDQFKSKHITRLSQLKDKLESSGNTFSKLTIDNCLDCLFLSLLVQNQERISTSLDFVFENLPRVLQKHSNLSHLAPEVVMLLLSNPRSKVKNNHGFPLPYSQSEKEVFKAMVKYMDSVQKGKQVKPAYIARIKNLLSVVADPHVLIDGNTSSADKRLLKESQMCEREAGVNHQSPDGRLNFRYVPKKPLPAPRNYHAIKFTKSNQPTGNEIDCDYFFQPFISSTVHSLDEIDISKVAGSAVAARPISMADISDESCVLRKLYFSYRRCHSSNVPYITKIGMQYSHRGKKRTVFIASCSSSLPGENKTAVLEGSTRHALPDTALKKSAIILKAGEHVTGISTLGQRALHNLELVTSTGRRIRAHSLQDIPTDAKWVAVATPTGNDPFCLHAIYGDLYISSSGRSHIRDVGALWMSTTTSGGMNDLG